MRYQVPLIAQPTPQSCWAASIAMVVSWSDPQRNYTPRDINSLVPDKTLFTQGASTRELLEIYPLFDMSAEPPVNYPEMKFLALLQQYGPLFVATYDFASPHAIVVTGLDPDPDPGKATVQPRPSAWTEPVIQRVTDQIVSEVIRVGTYGPDQLRRKHLV